MRRTLGGLLFSVCSSACIGHGSCLVHLMQKHLQFHLPISHSVDGIGGCEGLRKHLKEVEDIMHRGVSHRDENTQSSAHTHMHLQLVE